MSLNENEASVSPTKQAYINHDLELPKKNNSEPFNELSKFAKKNLSDLY